MSILNPTPNSFDLELTDILTSHSKYKPQLDAFNASLYLENSDTAFAHIEIPAMKAVSVVKTTIKQTVQIADMDQYTQYAKTVLSSEEYTMVLKGRGGLKEGGFPKTDVDYNKKITMKGIPLSHQPRHPIPSRHSLTIGIKGLNSLKGFQITDFNILLTTLPDGTNTNGTVLLPNPTVMTLELGNVTLSLSVDGTPIGHSTLPNLILKPGDNHLPMLAVTNESSVIGLLLQPKYAKGILPIEIVGNTSTFNGKDLPYYGKALQGNKLNVDLDVGKALTKAGLGSLLGNTQNSTEI
jgi:hypothetical protein